jgi:DNA transformation protein
MVGSREFVDFAIELLGPFGTVSSRPMFGGHGIYLDDLMFAIVHGDALWFKTDEMNKAEFEAVGSEPFRYSRNGKTATMSFYRAPAAAMDSPASAIPWARSAYAAAMRARGSRTDIPAEIALAPFVPSVAARRRTTAAKPARRAARRPSRATGATKRPATLRRSGTRNRSH